MTSYGYIRLDSRIISFNLKCIMQLKQFYNIATKVSSRKKCYYFWWSAWLLSATIPLWLATQLELHAWYPVTALLRSSELSSSVNISIIGPGNGLSLVLHEAVTLTIDDSFFIGPIWKHFIEIWIEKLYLSLKKISLKLTSRNWCSFVSTLMS